MPIREIEQIFAIKTASKKKNLPTVTHWKGTPIIRQHSFYAAINEIVNWAEEIDVTRIGNVGDMHSGKTTIAEAQAHAIHKMSKLQWSIRKLYEEDLMNFKETLKSLTPANYILIFDDVSFLDAKHNKKQINIVKEAVTKIRHLEGGRNVKIIMIYNYHYTMGLDKYLRQADFRFFTTVGSSERENMEGIVGSKSMRIVDNFTRQRQMGITKKFFGMMLPNKKFFSYKWRNPFIPVLFWNNATLRMIISPTREWLTPICSICAFATGESSTVNVKDFLGEFKAMYPSQWKAILKQLLREQGLNTYSKQMIGGRKFLDRAMEIRKFNLEELLLTAGFTLTKTLLRKKPEDMKALQAPEEIKTETMP